MSEVRKPKVTGKQRAVRIPLDYYKRRDPLGRWKLGLALLAPVVALGWWFGGDAVAPGRSELRISHGPLAVVHSTWEHQCEACHEPFQPVGTETWPEPYLKKYLGVSFAASNAKCQTCHEGPQHHAHEITEDVPSCASCHRDHRGSDASLVRSPDRDCTSCHADLKEHTKDPKPLAFEDVTGFHQAHPEFAIPGDAAPRVRLGAKEATDPSHLKFNHKVHMSPGMLQDYSLARILKEEDRERYRRKGQDDAAEVQLECASCHVLDPGDLAGATEAAPSPGRGGPGAYMMPIVYENQCRACHPLDVSRPGAGRKADAGGAEAGAASASLTVPHGVQPAEIHEFLTNTVAAQVLTKDPELPQRRRLPGPAGAAVQTVRQAIVDGVFQAEEVLFKGTQTCTECHNYTPLKPNEAADVRPGEPPNFKVEAPRVPDVWFVHAVFNHAAHRAVDCRQCHAKAYAADVDGKANPDASDTSDAVMLPSVETCRKCHAPAVTTASQARGGARFDCVECHRYHNGDHPRQGAGARAQDAKVKATIAEFLTHSGPFDQDATTPEPAQEAAKAAPPPSPP